MNNSAFFDDELEQIRKAERELLIREQECAKVPFKLAQEQREQECTIPPMMELEDRKRRILHEESISRGDVANILQDQNRSLILIVLYSTTAATMIWWALKFIQG
jgi:hypothetical protein